MLVLIANALDDPDDRKFFSDLYLAYKRLMFSTAKKYVSKPEDIEDIVQTALEKLIKNISALRPMEQCTLAAYIIYTVKSVAFDFHRKAQRTTAHDISLEYDKLWRIEKTYIAYADQERLMDDRERLKALWPQLPEDDRILLEGKYIWEKSDRELAEILHCKPDSIRMKLTRARRRALNNLMEKE